MKDWQLTAGSCEELENSFGQVGLAVLEDTKFERETFVLRRCLLALNRAGMLLFPVLITRADGQFEPDFFVRFGAGSMQALEVVEATTKEDGREAALHRKTNDVSQFGDKGGRVAVGLTDQEWQDHCIHDVQHAINRKLQKQYSAGCLILLVYLNGNPSVFRGRAALDEVFRNAIGVRIPDNVDFHILLNDRAVIAHAFRNHQLLIENS